MQVFEAVTKECKKSNIEYVALVAPHLGNLLLCFPRQSMLRAVLEITEPLLHPVTPQDDDTDPDAHKVCIRLACLSVCYCFRM